jgi:hypothetical protein
MSNLEDTAGNTLQRLSDLCAVSDDRGFDVPVAIHPHSTGLLNALRKGQQSRNPIAEICPVTSISAGASDLPPSGAAKF